MFAAAGMVALREGLEMSLILGIVFSYLRRVGRRDAFKQVWLGSGLAFVLCLAFGGVLYYVTNDQEWAGQAYLELFIFLAAVGVLSYMTFWMKKNSRAMSGQLHGRIDKALDQGGVFPLSFLAFITVIREMLEMVMFLLALATQNQQAAMVVFGGIVGLVAAILVGLGIYSGTTHINLGLFFKVMGNVLIVVAAGLLGNAVHAAIEVGWLHPVAYAYNLHDVLSSQGVVGAILHALIGYTDHPSVIQAGVWLVFLVIALVLFNRGAGGRTNPSVKSA